VIIRCPHCGETIEVSSSGRKPLNIPVIFICDVLRLHRSITAAARELGCSRGYIYKVLKINGLKVEDLVKRKVVIG
jgi:molybdenum-dependent DNA-binding transcriptional regulator ModE